METLSTEVYLLNSPPIRAYKPLATSKLSSSCTCHSHPPLARLIMGSHTLASQISAKGSNVTGGTSFAGM
jgi:hypothetical protein